jgi:multisubunit Na+/H+ antiporter MnhB subunit
MKKSKKQIATLIIFFICFGAVFLYANTYLKWTLFLVGVITLIASFLLYFVVFGFDATVKPEDVKNHRTIAIIFGFLALVNTINYFNGTKDKLPFLLLYWFVTILNAFVYFKNKANRIH